MVYLKTFLRLAVPSPMLFSWFCGRSKETTGLHITYNPDYRAISNIIYISLPQNITLRFQSDIFFYSNKYKEKFVIFTVVWDHSYKK